MNFIFLKKNRNDDWDYFRYFVQNGHYKNIIFYILFSKFGTFVYKYTITTVIQITQNQLIRLWQYKIK